MGPSVGLTVKWLAFWIALCASGRGGHLPRFRDTPIDECETCFKMLAH